MEAHIERQFERQFERRLMRLQRQTEGPSGLLPARSRPAVAANVGTSRDVDASAVEAKLRAKLEATNRH